MLLHPEPIGVIPGETARGARSAFPTGNAYLRMRDRLELLVEDCDLAHLFPLRGQPAERPWRLALITIFQFAEHAGQRAEQRRAAARACVPVGRLESQQPLPFTGCPTLHTSARAM